MGQYTLQTDNPCELYIYTDNRPHFQRNSNYIIVIVRSVISIYIILSNRVFISAMLTNPFIIKITKSVL
ncbi:hypothetical protein SAMN02910456_01187 [Ruminococcaceae bacterium YRB3002]|nr:hypothetical protein SAMN02910456_01187 [Ruminococcaceae bacterium YRB3002]